MKYQIRLPCGKTLPRIFTKSEMSVLQKDRRKYNGDIIKISSRTITEVRI